MRTPLWRFLQDSRATVSIDYGLLAVVIVAALFAPMVSIEGFLTSTLQAVSDALRDHQ